MWNDTLQNANLVFKGKLRENKKMGLDVSQPKTYIEQEYLNKLYEEYFYPDLEKGETEVLLYKVFFDIKYHIGRCRKEGLCALNKNSFQVKTSANGEEYVEITFNKVTKKNQGDSTASDLNYLYDNHAIIKEQKNSEMCPVSSFNTIGTFMSSLSDKAKLSKIYTNHGIRKTTATAMHRQGFDLKQIAHVTKHKNLQSLENYISAPLNTEKEDYSNALFEYTTKNDQNLKRKGTEKSTSNATAIAVHAKEKENLVDERALIIQDMQPPTAKRQILSSQSNQNVVSNTMTNQLRQAENFFSGATLHNCTINIQMPK